MVSKASELFPEPLNPVITVKVFLGISTVMFLRLCWRAPCTEIRSSIKGDLIHCHPFSLGDRDQTLKCEGISMAKHFRELSEREILALAISLEEEDGRIYAQFAEAMRENYPPTAQVLYEMQKEGTEHRDSLVHLFKSRFGEHIPLIRRQDVKGFLFRPAVWLVEPLGPKAVRKAISSMEEETRRLSSSALEKVSDESTRKLLEDLI